MLIGSMKSRLMCRIASVILPAVTNQGLAGFSPNGLVLVRPTGLLLVFRSAKLWNWLNFSEL